MPQLSGSIGWRQARAEEARRRPLLGESTLVPWFTYIIVALYALTFAYLSILKHDSYNTNAFDLGNMDQAAWNTAQGRWFEFSNWEGADTRLAAHVEPIFIPIAQLYHLYSSPETLLVLQAVVVSLGALPAFWLARDKLKNNFAALAFASAYLLAPALEVATLADFHPVALASSFLLFAFYFLDKRRYIPFFIMAVLAMATKEQVPLAVMAMGLYIALVQRNRKMGGITALVAFLWLVVAFGVIIPHYNPQRESPYLSRYDRLGDSPGQIMISSITQPGKVVSELTRPTKVEYVVSLLKPLVFLPLLSPWTLTFALPELGINLLSNFPEMHSGKWHYGAVLVPFLIISAILGARLLVSQGERISPKLGRFLVYVLSLAILVSSLVSYYREVFLPLKDHLPVVTDRNRLATSLEAMIPKEAALSISSTLNPHLSQRQRLYLFPRVDDAEYIFIDVTATPYPIDSANQQWRLMGLLESGQWGVAAARDGYLLLKKGAKEKEIPDEFYGFVKDSNLSIQQPAGVVFGQKLRLLGFSFHPNGILHGKDPYTKVTLYWEAISPMAEDYRMALYTIAESGALVDSSASHPATLWYPTSRWQPREVVKVEAELRLGDSRRVDILLGVVGGGSLGDRSARLIPDNSSAPSLELRQGETLVKLAELRAQ
ncbi:MAG: DUF2079 domain-containing protein [Chloroflexi bacterium]|nr:DUF2079 domain-containing protein [Chloroflexota bacterium]